MAHKYFDGRVPGGDPKVGLEFGQGLESTAQQTIKKFESFMESFEFHKALRAIWELIGQMNKTIDVTAPWVLAKKKSSRKHLETAIYQLLEGLRILAGLIYPVMPDTAKKMQKHLGLYPDAPFYHLDRLKAWGTLPAGTQLPKSVILFPRIEAHKQGPDLETTENEESAVVEIKPEISIDEFNRIDLRVATVVHAEGIPRAKKLLKLEVDMGQKRTLVAGIAEKYAAEDLIGKQVIIVANLKPAKLMGILSNGMLIAAVDDAGPTLATLGKKVAPGTPLK